MSSTTLPSTQPGVLKRLAWRTGRLVLIGLLFGWLYAWAAPRFYPKSESLGFGYGMIHGALMPMALPSLVLGHDVLIYAPNNNGRLYKLGYTVGINICGLVFFGLAFARPRSRKETSRRAAGLLRQNSPPQ